jgi:hypothetical protein
MLQSATAEDNVYHKYIAGLQVLTAVLVESAVFWHISQKM